MRTAFLVLLCVFTLESCVKDAVSWKKTMHYALSGTVKDRATGLPIQGVKIRLQILDGPLGILDVHGTIAETDPYGKFHITYSYDREYLIYVAQLSVDVPDNTKYQLGLMVNEEAHCRAYFPVDETGDYDIQALPFPEFRLLVPAVPAGWETGILELTLTMANDNCSDTLLTSTRSAVLNDPVTMGSLAAWQKILRSNQLTIDYTVKVDNVQKLSKRITTECAYGTKTEIELKLE